MLCDANEVALVVHWIGNWEYMDLLATGMPQKTQDFLFLFSILFRWHSWFFCVCPVWSDEATDAGSRNDKVLGFYFNERQHLCEIQLANVWLLHRNISSWQLNMEGAGAKGTICRVNVEKTPLDSLDGSLFGGSDLLNLDTYSLWQIDLTITYFV